jgi:hypothetical protein
MWEPLVFFNYHIIVLGNIVTFIKVLSIYHSWFKVLIILLCTLLEQFQQVSFFHFHIWVRNVSTTFTSYTLSLYPPPSHRYQPPDRTVYLPVLHFWKKTFLFKIGTFTVPFPYYIYIWIIIHTHIYIYVCVYYNPNWEPLLEHVRQGNSERRLGVFSDRLFMYKDGSQGWGC